MLSFEKLMPTAIIIASAFLILGIFGEVTYSLCIGIICFFATYYNLKKKMMPNHRKILYSLFASIFLSITIYIIVFFAFKLLP
ncbi:hypothetical protein ACO1PK_09680 [Alishewanella sp. d11]|uniref:hypothetical protein n=1 Tax=Alishewanella sp. d11 TaxID=3414030 RepID=UPI003BF8DE16